MMLCYKTHDNVMLYNTRYVMLHNTCYVILYNT